MVQSGIFSPTIQTPCRSICHPLGKSFPVSRYAAAWLVNQQPDSTGLIVNEGSGFGDARTMQPGKALDLNGIDQYGLADNATGWPINGEPRTFCGWVRQTNTTGQIFCYGNTNSFKRWSVVGGANLRVEIQGGGYSSSTLPAVNDGEWHFVAVVLEETGGTIGDHTLYVDDQSETASGTTNLQTETTQQPTIGKILVSSSQYLEGAIFDLRFYNKALTADEIQHVYTFGESGTDPTTDNLLGQWKCDDNSTALLRDSSGNGNDVTLVNSPTTYVDSDVPHSFQNSDGYTTIYSTDDTLIEATKPTGLVDIEFDLISTETDQFIIFSPGVSGTYLLMAVPGDSGVIKFATPTGTITIDGVSFVGTRDDLHTLLTDGSVHHVVCNDVDFSSSNWDPGIYFGGYATGGWVNDNTTIANLTIDGVAYNGPDLLPRDEANPTKDIYGFDLQYTGQQPPKAYVEDSACLTLNGTDQAVTGVSVSAPTFPFSLACFAETSTITGALIGLGSSSVANEYFVLRANAGDSVGVVRRDAVNQYVDDYAVSSLIGSGPVHYCVVFESSTQIKIYRNGSLDVDATVTAMALPTLTHLNIGCLRSISPTGYKQGKFAGAVYYNFALTDEQVQVLAAGGFVASAENLLPLADGSTANTGVTQVTDRVSGNQYTIQNHTVDCWANTQKVSHSNTVNGFSWDDSARIPPSLSDPTVDAIAGLPLTNPPGGLNGSESTINFCEEPLAPLFNGRDVPGDGVLANYAFDGDPGDLSIGIDTATKEARFTLSR